MVKREVSFLWRSDFFEGSGKEIVERWERLRKKIAEVRTSEDRHTN